MTTKSSTVPQLELNDGNRIPQLGFGVFEIPPEDTADLVEHALATGYRAIDTAAAYGNERQVAEAIERGGLDREDVFVTTKLWNGDHGRDRARRALERSLERLGFEFVDLYLIHWPVPSRDKYLETWQALSEIKANGLARSIGVSNFNADHLERIIDETDVVPTVNQIELHPYFQQAQLRRLHERYGILTEAWSPLARGGEVLTDRVVEQIAAAHDRSTAQIVLRWHVQLGSVVIPRSATPSRIEENFELFDFELSSDEMQAIAELDAGRRIGPDPATFSLGAD